MSEKSEALVLIAYRIHKMPSMRIVPASSRREWMDVTREHFANRCLPLLISNQAGWFILNSHRTRAIWNGSDDVEGLRIICKESRGKVPCPAVSHFGHGILTWNLNYLFRTPPGYNLLVRGPANLLKDGIYPLEGIVETDWSVATFTMNWKMTNADVPVDFEVGEPICMLVPQRRGELEAFQPMMGDLSSAPDIERGYKEWSESRSEFIKNLKVPGSDAVKAAWQRNYMYGSSPGGVEAREHQIKLELREFEELEKGKD